MWAVCETICCPKKGNDAFLFNSSACVTCLQRAVLADWFERQNRPERLDGVRSVTATRHAEYCVPVPTPGHRGLTPEKQLSICVRKERKQCAYAMQMKAR